MKMKMKMTGYVASINKCNGPWKVGTYLYFVKDQTKSKNNSPQAIEEDDAAITEAKEPDTRMEHGTEVPIRFVRDKDDKESKTERSEGMMRRKQIQGQQGDINKLADAFINNFRNQLTFQWDEPIKYNREMKV